jgi:hypothetical protein
MGSNPIPSIPVMDLYIFYKLTNLLLNRPFEWLHSKKTSITTATEKNRRVDLEMKIDSLTEGALPYFRSIFKQMTLANPENSKIVCEFLIAEYNEQNIKLSSRLTKIKIIYLFDKYLVFKPFEQITKQDILDILVY